jgi:hypothetical protein
MVLTIRTAVLFVHIVGMLGMFAALSWEWLFLQRLPKVATRAQLQALLDLLTGLPRLHQISGLAILLPGLYLAARSGAYQSGWVPVSVIAMVLAIALGPPIIGRRVQKLQEMASRDGELDRTSTRDPMLLASLQTRSLISLGIVYLMIAKPASWLVAVLVIIVAAACGIVLAAASWSRSATRL